MDEFDEIMKSKKLISEYKKANLDIMETLRCLPVVEQKTFVLAAYKHAYGHFTFAEISLVLELNEKEIRSTLAKSNETLLKELKHINKDKACL
ncbi:hypothetical protein FACS1894102_7530 [Spirochaetia bacterium]|nr:hypothetical protein FACS1894102_7530 [Spirochaetia bacterium]